MIVLPFVSESIFEKCKRAKLLVIVYSESAGRCILCAIGCSGGDAQPTKEEKLTVIVYSESAGRCIVFVAHLMQWGDTQVPLGGSSFISLTWAKTNRQTDKDAKTQTFFQNQIFVDSVGHI